MDTLTSSEGEARGVPPLRVSREREAQTFRRRSAAQTVRALLQELHPKSRGTAFFRTLTLAEDLLSLVLMNIPKKILVATDFNAPSEAAVAYAVSLAQKLGAKVHVVHAFELPLVGFPDGVMTITAEMAARILDGAQTALSKVSSTYAERGVMIETSLEQADPREAVLTAAKKVGADLIVMGTHGRRGIARALIGSVTEAVVRTSPVPVLTVHAESNG